MKGKERESLGTTEWTMNLEVIKQKKLGAGKEGEQRGRETTAEKGKSYMRGGVGFGREGHTTRCNCET